jgi:hypothetical protein
MSYFGICNICEFRKEIVQETLTEGEGSITADLRVLTSLDQLIYKPKIKFTFLTKQGIFMRRSTVLSLSLQLVFPGWSLG